MTKTQEREQARLDRIRQDEEWARKVQQARDRNLLLTFENEGALEKMRQREIVEIDSEIRLATQRILALDKELKQAQKAAEAWVVEKKVRTAPFTMQQRITETANAILAEDSLITDRQQERDKVNSRYDADARRLRELLHKPSAEDRAGTRTPRS